MMRTAVALRVWLICSIVIAASGCGDEKDLSVPPAPSATPTHTSTRTATITPQPTSTSTSVPTSTATVTATATASPLPFDAATIVSPPAGALALDQSVPISIDLDPRAASAQLHVMIDGQTIAVTRDGNHAEGQATNIAPGTHELMVHLEGAAETKTTTIEFETVSLVNPDECEVLNNASCLLPYPSSRFEEAADTATGVRLRFPANGMPAQRDRRLPIEPWLALDGFSPTVSITMHFVGGADPELSHASRLLADTRTYDLTSLDPNSPSVLMDADTGERVLHFIEPDARAVRDAKPDREVLILHPATSLIPGHHYIVAMRRLVTHAGTPVVAEPAFAAFRDRRPSTIPAVETRRARMETLFEKLASHGVAREDLVLAFDFTVASDESLTGQMLSMRDETFAWLADNRNTKTFTVTRVIENDCSVANTRMWRRVEGTFQVPLYLKKDPLIEPKTAVTFNLDETGKPTASGYTNPPFTIAIPCGALDEGGPTIHPVILGHGLFGDGRGFVADLAESSDVPDFNYFAAATDWTGLASLDSGGGDDIPNSFVGRVALDQPRAFPALPDRTRQGQLNTLVLARMVKTAVFNLDPAFQQPDGSGVLPGEDVEEFYFGASLGGIMGLMFAALSPDVTNVHVDVPAINFGFLLPRSIAFLPFEAAIKLTGVSDPIDQALLLVLTHELWARGESAGYATHITSNPLPGSSVKNILMTAAIDDQLVSNFATEIAARTLGIPSLIGSVLPNRPQIPDREGPLSSALIYYDAASFDHNDPDQAAFIPPITNLQPVINHCDPHGRQAYIPAAIDQLFAFLQPGGEVLNFCNGLCDAAEPKELPFGGRKPCRP